MTACTAGGGPRSAASPKRPGHKRYRPCCPRLDVQRDRPPHPLGVRLRSGEQVGLKNRGRRSPLPHRERERCGTCPGRPAGHSAPPGPGAPPRHALPSRSPGCARGSMRRSRRCRRSPCGNGIRPLSASVSVIRSEPHLGIPPGQRAHRHVEAGPADLVEHAGDLPAVDRAHIPRIPPGHSPARRSPAGRRDQPALRYQMRPGWRRHPGKPPRTA